MQPLKEIKCRIRAVQLGEVDVNMVHQDRPVLQAKFVLLNTDFDACGSTSQSHGWSDKTLDLLRQLAVSMEEDILPGLFELPTTPTEGEIKQF